jgi:hypothetical protein
MWDACWRLEPAAPPVCLVYVLLAYINICNANMHWRIGFAFCLSTLLCLLRAHRSLSSVNICGHRILLDKSGEDPGNGQKLPSKWSSLKLLPVPLLGYSEFEHTRPASE